MILAMGAAFFASRGAGPPEKDHKKMPHSLICTGASQVSRLTRTLAGAPTPAARFVRLFEGCHRGSTNKPVQWGKMSRVERARRYANAEHFDRSTKRPGRHGGVIGHTALKVYHTLLFGFFNIKTGRLDPSYDAIARRANLSRKAVWAALRRLKELRLISWTRRCSDQIDHAGRLILRQETNAYQVQPEGEWKGFRPIPEAPRVPAVGTWGAPAPVLDAMAQYTADRDMGLSQEAAAAALARVAESRLEIVTARLYAQMQARQSRGL